MIEVFIDGGGPRKGRIFAGVFSPELRWTIHKELEHHNPTSVVAEFMALELSLEQILSRGVKAEYLIFTDNTLVEQMWIGCRLSAEHLAALRKRIFAIRNKIEDSGSSVYVQWIERKSNTVADALTHAPWPPKKRSLRQLVGAYENGSASDIEKLLKKMSGEYNNIDALDVL